MDESSPVHEPTTPSWVADAIIVIAEHQTERWTGCCSACGRPDPCPVAADAAALVLRHRATSALHP